MTDTSDQDRPYNVLMHREVGDQIDYSLSPMDGAIAVEQIYNELPLFHRPVPPRGWHRLIPGYVRLYRGLLSWGGVGFRYVQIGDTLHVVDAGCVSSDRFRPDTVLPEPAEEQYILDEDDYGDGVSVLTIG